MAWVLYGGDDVEVRNVALGGAPALVPGAAIGLYLDSGMSTPAATPADVRAVGGGALSLPLYVNAVSQVPAFEARDDATFWYQINGGPVARLYPAQGPILDDVASITAIVGDGSGLVTTSDITYVSATKYGITGTPQASDAANLQAVIDDAYASGFGRRGVDLPAGTIGLTAAIDRKGVPLRGQGSIAGTSIRWDGAAGATVITSGSSISGGISGITFTKGTNEPATWLDCTTLVDAMFRLDDVGFGSCSGDAVKVQSWANLHWSRIRWDGCGGYAIRLTPPNSQFNASFVLDKFTYDHTRSLAGSPSRAPARGAFLIDTSVNNPPNIGPMAFRHGRIEVNANWESGSEQALFTIKRSATPNSALSLLFDSIAYNGTGSMTDSVVYRLTSDTASAEQVFFINCEWGNASTRLGGTWPTKQQASTVPAAGTSVQIGASHIHGSLDIRPNSDSAGLRLRPHTAQSAATFQIYNKAGTLVGSIDSDGNISMVGNGTSTPLSVVNNSSGAVASKLHNTNVGGVLIGRGSQSSPLDVMAPDGTTARVRVGAGGDHIRFGSAADVQFGRTAADVASMGTGDSFAVDGTWNGGTIRLGAYRLWVDAAGALRIKSGAPSSDTDGTVVGTQT